MRYITWGLVNFDIILLVFIILATIFVTRKNKNIAASILFFFVSITCLIIITPLPEWGMTLLENRFSEVQQLPKDVKGVIIIGGIVDRKISQVRGEPSFNMFGARMVPLLKLMETRPELTYMIMGGGKPYIEGYQEADILMRHLDYIKPKLGKLLFDNISSTTVESAQVSYNMIKPKRGEKWLLLTSAYHMPRAVGVFKNAGWDIIPYPVDFRTSGKYEWRINLSLWWGFMMWSIFAYELMMNLTSYMNGESYAFLPSENH